MEVLDFMNAHDDWEEVLTQPPYSLKVSRLGNYVLLKYNQYESDMSLKIVQESRGCIFYRNENGAYECVCRAFDKFFNYGEDNAATIDWSSAVVEEKVDGSCIRFWYHDGWRIATNGMILASIALVGDDGITFEDLIFKALGGKNKLLDFIARLDTANTYMFELVSPQSRCTIYYPETQLYYLGHRNMATMQEYKEFPEWMREYGVLCPKTYPLSNLKDCLAYVENMTRDEEGFVIRDKNFNRIKLKSPAYLQCFHAVNNGVCTTKRILKMMRDDTLDDFVAYAPQFKDQVRDVLLKLEALERELCRQWTKVQEYTKLDRKEFARAIHNTVYNADFLFAKYMNPDLNVADYVNKQTIKALERMLNGY